jgi:hypothetical protein
MGQSTGNGSQSGPRYTLEIIGVPKGKNASMTNNNGHRMFVLLGSSSQDSPSDVWLCYPGQTLYSAQTYDTSTGTWTGTGSQLTCPSSEEYGVLDANATDTSADQSCYPGGSTTSNSAGYTINYFTCGGGLFEMAQSGYQIYGRALGKPGGNAGMNTCGTYSYLDPTTGTYTTAVLCNASYLPLARKTGKSVFQDVTTYLTQITITSAEFTAYPGLASCLGVSGTSSVTVNIFNNCLQNYFWYYDNNGLKHYQLAFF